MAAVFQIDRTSEILSHGDCPPPMEFGLLVVSQWLFLLSWADPIRANAVIVLPIAAAKKNNQAQQLDLGAY